MFTILNIILLFIFLSSVISIQLTNNQIKYLGKLKQTHLISENQKMLCNTFIFKAYKGFSINKVFEFKQIHKHKCFNIPNNELIYYSYMGLHKATIKYNGSYNFNRFAEHYILGELLNCISDRCHNSILPKYLRKMNSNNLFNTLSTETINKSKINFVSSNEWIFDKNNNNNNSNSNNSSVLDELIQNGNYRELWLQINKINDPFVRRIINLKFDYNFNKIRNNNQLAGLMCCSKELIRTSLQKYITNNDLQDFIC